MTEPHNAEIGSADIRKVSLRTDPRPRRVKRRLLITATLFAVTVAVGLICTAWFGSKMTGIQADLEAVMRIVPLLEDDLTDVAPKKAVTRAEEIRSYTSAARKEVDDPMWTAAAAIPGIGANFSAVTEVVRSADDVANLGVAPLVKVFDSLNWESLLPNREGTDLEPLRTASPSITSAAHVVRASAQRLEGIDASALLPQIAEPLRLAREKLRAVTGALDASAYAAQIAPGMLGGDDERNYLLVIQNNAEARASGGIPGALAVLNLNHGKLTLGRQSSAGDVGVMSPVIPVDAEQQQIYSTRLGKYMQDVNLTPDFPTAATTAQAMWEKKTGQRVDGVISMDPVALGYVLDATGPVKISGTEMLALAGTGLPTELTGKNVVPTLLSDVYAKIPLPKHQDAYFAGVAKEVFSTLSSGGTGNAKGLIDGISRGASEGRILLWSAAAQEQLVLAKYPVSGTIAGPSNSPAQFGVYFNDGTGAKMDYYVKRTVQLVEECTGDGYREIKVRITSTNTAPTDAATSLPEYVTGGGIFGVPAGTVRTNVIAYGPTQADVETARVDGKKANFSAQNHANRPVGMLTVTLAPGQSSEAEFTFGKIVQHADPQVVVTPSVQALSEVILPSENAGCGVSK